MTVKSIVVCPSGDGCRGDKLFDLKGMLSAVAFHHELECRANLTGEPIWVQAPVGDGRCGLERIFRDLSGSGENGTGGVISSPGSVGATVSPQATKPRAMSTTAAPRLNVLFHGVAP